MSPRARFALFFTIVFGIWALPHFYVWWRLISIPPFHGGYWGYVLVAVFVTGFVGYPVARTVGGIGLRRLGKAMEYLAGLWIGFMLLSFASFVVVDMVTLGGELFPDWVSETRTAAALLGVGLSLWAWFRGFMQPRVVSLEVKLPGLPSEADGTKLVHLSDVHLGAMIGVGKLRSIIRKVRALEPDIVAITGDLVDGNVAEVTPMLDELKKLTAPRGVFAVLGNHEYYAGAEGCRKLFLNAGFNLLDDAHAEVRAGLTVAGVTDRRGAMQTGKPGGDLKVALDGIDNGNAVVLLQHSPENEQAAEAAGVGLMLNGHTHGGQIFPMHLLVRIFFPHLAGVYQVGRMTQVVSRGTGRWGPPMRLLAPSEIIAITLRSR